jgi:hypothetical protein
MGFGDSHEAGNLDAKKTSTQRAKNEANSEQNQNNDERENYDSCGTAQLWHCFISCLCLIRSAQPYTGEAYELDHKMQ